LRSKKYWGSGQGIGLGFRRVEAAFNLAFIDFVFWLRVEEIYKEGITKFWLCRYSLEFVLFLFETGVGTWIPIRIAEDNKPPPNNAKLS
jgi:hypothetical protein